MQTRIAVRLLAAIAAAVFVCVPKVARAEEEVCGACDKKVLVSGQFQHSTSDVFRIDNAGGQEAAFRDDIHGGNFTLSIPNLEPGKYTLEIGEVELQFGQVGQRLFDIICGDHVIARNLDLFDVAGVDKAFRIQANVEHEGDAAHGPLSVRFIGLIGEAKLNTFELKNAAGTSIVSLKAADLIGGDDAAALVPPTVDGPVIWKDPLQPLDARVNDLVRRMSLAEKAAQMQNSAPAISRLGLSGYNYWNECLHGVARSGTATVFPQAIGMAAMWNSPLLHDIADTIATEARAKHNEYARLHDGESAKYCGLTFWTPNINIFRDPRWGRGQETYGEDPFLTSRMAVAFIRGLQGDDPKYVKAMACAKHFAVHSGPESTRHIFDAEIPERDFYETYLPHFEAAVREAKVGTVMGAYNSLYGSPACASTLLLSDILRKEWGFDGHVVSDCGAIFDIYANHHAAASPEEAAARAVLAGCDLCCGNDYTALTKAVRKRLITEQQVDVAVKRVLTARFRLGLFDPPDQCAYARIPFSENDSPAHEALALRAARESLVLLKNDGLLPLDRAKFNRIAVIGVNGNSTSVLLGNYNGTPSRPVTVLEGIRVASGTNIDVIYDTGGPLALPKTETRPIPADAFDRVTQVISNADAIIYVGGLHPVLEGEQMQVDYAGFSGGDRTDIVLPAVQIELLKALKATGKPLVFVNCSGSAVAMGWAAENVPAILQAWYPGEQGGRAVAEAIFGDINPGGKLPITFYQSVNDLPPFDDYTMKNRTYRFFTGKPLYAFGHGMSYTKFEFDGAKLDRSEAARADSVAVTMNIKNAGQRDGDEVAEIFYRHVKSALPQAQLALCGFARVNVPAGKTIPVSVRVPIEQFRYWDTAAKKYAVEPGDYEILVGDASDHILQKLPLKVH